MHSEKVKESVVAAQAGDADAFRHLVEANRRMVFGICYRVTDNRHDAEDLAHESFVEAYIKLHTLNQPDKITAWLRTLTLNICRGWYRRRKRELAFQWREAMPMEQVANDSSFTQLFAGLDQLAPAHRLALVLHYLEGLSYEETSSFLDVPVGTVMSRLHRARKELKKQIERLGDLEEIPMVNEEQFSEEVDAEISLLLRMFQEEPNAMERLSVILNHNPERIQHLLSEPLDDATVENLSMLVPHLGAPIMGILLDLYFDAKPLTRTNALTLLQMLVARCRSECSGTTAPMGVGLGDMPGFDGYLLLDQLIQYDQQQEPVAELLVELLQVVDDAPTGQLFSEVMLSLDETTHILLSDRFWKIDAVEEVYRRSNWIVPTLRNRGTGFLKELTDDLRNNPARAKLALRGMDMLMLGAWDFRQRGGKPTVPGARFICETIAPELVALVQLDTGTIEAAAAEAVQFLADDDTILRNTALRVLERLQDREHIEQIRVCLTHPVISTRISAIQTLAGLEDLQSAAAMMSIAKDGEANERSAAIAALGRLGIREAQQLLIETLDDEDSTVVRAALIALGELDREQAAVHVQRFLSSPDKNLRSAASKTLYRTNRKESEEAHTSPQSKPHFSGDLIEDPKARRAHHISADAAIRVLPELRDYSEREITERISLVCGDWAATRRRLIEHRLVTRAEGIYQFTELGAAAWRVEHFIMENYLRG